MKARSAIVSLMLLILAAFPMQAQWSGSADLSTGVGGMKGDELTRIGYLGHLITKGNVSIRYRPDTVFTWNTSLNGNWETKTNDNTRLNLNLAQPDQPGLEFVYKTVKTRPMQFGIRSDFDWKPSRERKYSAWISYRYRNDRARNVSNALSGTLNLEGMDMQQLNRFYESPKYLLDLFNQEVMDSQQASCYYETPRLTEHTITTGLRGDWQLGDKHLLQGSLSLSNISSKKNTTWSVFKTDEAPSGDIDINEAFHRGDAWMYRITPSSIDLDFSADLHLKRTVRKDTVMLNWGPGIRVFGNSSLDHNSGATLVDIDDQGSYIWRDSLRLRESFNFLSIIPAPYISMEYDSKKLHIQADYSLQFWLCRLNDDTRRQPIGLQGLHPKGNSSLTWKISDVHRLGITHSVGVDYPNYLQMCWYDRTGGYVDQLFRGNADLASSMFSRYGMTYDLAYKHFRYRMTNAVTRRINEIDQTWSNEEIEGRLYKVFHWINAADSWSFGTAHRIGWEAKRIKTGVGAEYNQSRRTAKKDGTVKDASDWRLTADLSSNLGKGWSFGADAKYQSRVSTFFSRFNEYWEIDAHVQKKFKHFVIYLDGRDLLDNARQTTFESTDGKEFWVDVARNNRRLFLLGVQWTF